MTEGGPCCQPGDDGKRGRDDPGAASFPEIQPGPDAGSRQGMITMDGERFLMGGEGPEIWPGDGEGPVREVTLSPFAMDRCAVSNAQFERFAEATGYETEAERFGWSVVFYNQVPKAHRKRQTFAALPDQPWWLRVEKADWRRPGGPGTRIQANHPVVHVSWNDATAYARWMGKRLPAEAEWEFAARGGLKQALYPWGDALTPGGRHHCNIWQGKFPEEDTAEDGYAGTCPVRTFPANGLGFHNMAGNVWEWTADWFSPDWHRTGPKTGPKGPGQGTSRIIRGGSFLCHHSYCNRYRVSARTSVTPESSTCHTGFRLAMDA